MVAALICVTQFIAQFLYFVIAKRLSLTKDVEQRPPQRGMSRA